MQNLIRATAFFALALFAQMAGTTTLAGSNTFVDLAWTVSGPASQGCNRILADATGDASRSTRIVIYGTLNCPSLGVGYPMTGVAYIGTNGSFNMMFNIAQNLVTCANMNGPSGSCVVLNVAGVNIGTVNVTLVP